MVDELIKKSNMSKKEFADYFGIQYRTLQTWTLGTRKCPEYLVNLMEYKLEKEGKIK